MTTAAAPALPGPALLFCPADRPDRYPKALAAADGVVLDLEDAVADDAKAAAREALQATVLDPSRVVVRINGATSPHHAADVAALSRTPYRAIMLPKAEDPAQLAALARWHVVALCETPGGILAAERLAAAPNVIALMWGAEDLVAAMGGSTSRWPDGRYRDFARQARASVLFAAKAHDRHAVDSVYVNFTDRAGLAAEAHDAAETGFDSKACIHPTQVEIIRDAFQPTEAQLVWAKRVLAAEMDHGVTSIDGQMIDQPLIAQARRVLRRDRSRRTP